MVGGLRRGSYILVALLVLVAGGTVLWRWDMLVFVLAEGALAVGLILLWFAVKPRAETVKQMKRLKAALGAGHPVVAHFFSAYCLLSIANRGAAPALARRHGKALEVVRIDLDNPTGGAIAREHRAASGTWIVFDSRGKEVGRGARLPRTALKQVLSGRR